MLREEQWALNQPLQQRSAAKLGVPNFCPQLGTDLLVAPNQPLARQNLTASFFGSIIPSALASAELAMSVCRRSGQSGVVGVPKHRCFRSGGKDRQRLNWFRPVGLSRRMGRPERQRCPASFFPELAGCPRADRASSGKRSWWTDGFAL